MAGTRGGLRLVLRVLPSARLPQARPGRYEPPPEPDRAAVILSAPSRFFKTGHLRIRLTRPPARGSSQCLIPTASSPSSGLAGHMAN